MDFRTSPRGKQLSIKEKKKENPKTEGTRRWKRNAME
jgi:hypothetical protein